MTFFADIETLLYAVSRIFLAPVLALIALALGYALVMLGAFLVCLLYTSPSPRDV